MKQAVTRRYSVILEGEVPYEGSGVAHGTIYAESMTVALKSLVGTFALLGFHCTAVRDSHNKNRANIIFNGKDDYNFQCHVEEHHAVD